MSNSANVNAGDTALASQYNNLRTDVLAGHDHITAGEGATLGANSVDTTQLVNNSVTGIKTTELLYDVHRQDDTSDSAVADQTIRKGWGYMTGDGTGLMEEVVTTGITFDSPPIVLISGIGHRLVSGGAPNSIDDFGLPSADVVLGTEDISTTAFKAVFSGTTLANTNNYGYAWIAIGTKAK